MARFKHHSYFSKPKHEQTYRFPFVCFQCRKSFKFPASLTARLCPEGHGPMHMLSRKFSAPKSSNLKQWQKVKFLVDHGFRFYSVYRVGTVGGSVSGAYPSTLAEAQEFVLQFQPLPTKNAA